VTAATGAAAAGGPRVTVLVPNLDQGRYLGRCLDSVLGQTDGRWHAVVADNASSDDSVAVVRSYRDPRLRLVRRPRTVSMMANWNLLAGEIDTEYAVLLSADDWWEPRFLERTVALLDAHPESLLAAAAVRVVEGEREVEVLGLHQRWPAARGACPPSAALRLLLTSRNRLYIHGVLARREVYERRPFEDSPVADWIMLVRAAGLAPVQVCPEVLACYRRHDAGHTSRADRAGLWGLELVRAWRLLAAEWAADPPPVAGAARLLARTFTLKLLVESYHRACAGDREAARFQCRLARSIAPTPGWRAFALWCERAAGLLGARWLRRLAPLEARLGARW